MVSGQTATEVLDIFSSTPGFRPAVEISGMTIENGSWDTGGDIYSTGAALTLSGTTVSGGKATTNGGGIFLTGGALWTDSSTVISGNSAKYGGGLYDTYASVFIGGSTFASNTASTEGGAVYQTGNLVSENATYTKNSSPDGGVFYNDLGRCRTPGSTYSGSSLTGSEEYGSVIDNDDAASISNATVTSSSSTANVSNLYGGVFYNTERFSAVTHTRLGDRHLEPLRTDCDLYGGVSSTTTRATSTYRASRSATPPTAHRQAIPTSKAVCSPTQPTRRSVSCTSPGSQCPRPPTPPPQTRSTAASSTASMAVRPR